MFDEFASDELADIIIDTLLDHKGFENFWFDLEDTDQDKIVTELTEAIAEWMSGEEIEEME